MNPSLSSLLGFFTWVVATVSAELRPLPPANDNTQVKLRVGKTETGRHSD